MGQFKKFGGPKGNSFGFNRNSARGGNNRFGKKDRGPKELFPATCGDCGNNCEVPFPPTGKFPVYCNDCFKDHNNNSRSFSPKKEFGGDRDSYSKKSSFGHAPAANGVTKEQFAALEKKVDSILNLLHSQKRDAAPVEETTLMVGDVVPEKKTAKKAVKKAVKKPAKKAVKKVAKKKK